MVVWSGENPPEEEKEAALSSDKVTIKIPRPLYEKLQTIIEDTGFRSVSLLCIS